MINVTSILSCDQLTMSGCKLTAQLLNWGECNCPSF